MNPQQWRREWDQLMRDVDEKEWRMTEERWKKQEEQRRRKREEKLAAFFAEDEEEHENTFEDEEF